MICLQHPYICSVIVNIVGVILGFGVAYCDAVGASSDMYVMPLQAFPHKSIDIFNN